LAQQFPPGHPGTPAPGIPDDDTWLVDTAPVVRALIEAHARAYDVIHQTDTVDADGDGRPASVGWTIATQYMAAVDPENPADVAAADGYRVLLNYVYPDAIAFGEWDPDFDGQDVEDLSDWVGKQDFIGVQYYTRTWVLANPLDYELLTYLPCIGPLADIAPACPDVDPLNLSYINEVYPEGLYEVLREFAERYPDVPLPVTENGSAANNGTRKAQILVRHLAQVHRAIEEGLPIDAYYAWSLTDNFEWAAGFEPRFGLYHVDYQTFERTPTRAQEVLAEVAETGQLSGALQDELGGGPLLADDVE
jgi:beta-glucosidase